jgi:hypothetical protein
MGLLSRRLHPFRGAAPERVAMLGSEEAQMADFGRAGVGGSDGQDFRLGCGNPEQRSSTAGRVAQGSSDRHSERNAPL